MEKKEIEKRIIDMLKTCYDPEIPVDVYELGLIYEIKITGPSPALPPSENAQDKLGKGEKNIDEGNSVLPSERQKPGGLLCEEVIGGATLDPNNPNNSAAKVLPFGKDLGWDAEIIMTLTSPNCPVVESLPMEIEEKVRSVVGVNSAKIKLTFNPPWEKSMMSEAAQLELGFL